VFGKASGEHRAHDPQLDNENGIVETSIQPLTNDQDRSSSEHDFPSTPESIKDNHEEQDGDQVENLFPPKTIQFEPENRERYEEQERLDGEQEDVLINEDGDDEKRYAEDL
jgi:hypothetical protein